MFRREPGIRRAGALPFPGWSRVEVPARLEHRATVIWLHGLGADGTDFLPVVPALGLPESFGVRFVFPEAPLRPVTLNGGMVMRAWYDIRRLSSERHANRSQVDASAAGLRALIGQERERGVSADRIVLAGFSQGGAVALQAAVTPGPGGAPPPAVAGVLAMSTYLPFPERIAPPSSSAPPILLAHGTEDEMLPLHLAARTRDFLTASGWKVDFRTYSMGHQVVEREIRDAGRFLRRVLAPPAATSESSR